MSIDFSCAYRQVYGRLAHLGVDVEKLKHRNAALPALEKLADMLEELEREYNRTVRHERNLLFEHTQMKEAGMRWCDICPCSLEGVPR